jgi:RNA polymerase sigma-70 factor (ECF subfamily)
VVLIVSLLRAPRAVGLPAGPAPAGASGWAGPAGWASPTGLAALAAAVAMVAGGPPAAPPGRTRGAGQSGSPDDAHATRVHALVQLAQAGDAEAFGQIYEQYVDVVYRYVYVRVGSHTLAEDITSETFLRALRRLDGFTWQGRDIAAWFVTIARNLITDHHRSGRSRFEITTDELLGADPASPGAGPGPAAPELPEDVVLERARNARLVEAIRQLRPEQQECLTLRFFHEFSLAETAKALGRSEGAVKQLQLRSVRALAAILGGDRP